MGRLKDWVETGQMPVSDKKKSRHSSLSQLMLDLWHKMPFVKYEEPAYYNGMEDDGPSEDSVKTHLIYIIMGVYGSVAGFFACQYCKYLSQRFGCLAWGIEFTSRKIQHYGVFHYLVDIIAVFVVYFLVGTLGVLLNTLLKMLWAKDIYQGQEVCQIGMMYGLVFMVVVSLIMLIIPWNIFLIGVP